MPFSKTETITTTLPDLDSAMVAFTVEGTPPALVARVRLDSDRGTTVAVVKLDAQTAAQFQPLIDALRKRAAAAAGFIQVQ